MKRNETVNKQWAHMEGKQIPSKNDDENEPVEVPRNQVGKIEKEPNQPMEIGVNATKGKEGRSASQLNDIPIANCGENTDDSSVNIKKEKETFFEISRGMEGDRAVGDARSAELPTCVRRKPATENKTEDNDDPVVDEVTATATAIFESAIRDMQFTSSESVCTQGEQLIGAASISITINSPGEIEAPPRRVPRKVARLQRRNSRSTESLAVLQDFPKRKVSDCTPAISDHRLHPLEVAEKSDNLAVPTRKWSSSESLTPGHVRLFPESKSSNDLCETTSSDREAEALLNGKIYCSRSVNDVRTENLEVPGTSMVTRSAEDLLEDASPRDPCHGEAAKEGPSRCSKNFHEKSTGTKEKRTIGSLRSSLERKVGFMEKVLEDRIERIWEEKVEKHPWLQPIESWIADHRKLETTLEVKFTAPEKEKLEPKIESRIIEQLKKRRRVVPPKAESADADSSPVSSKLGKTELSTSCPVDGEEATNRLIDKEGLLNMKDLKHTNHDLFDKIKDNVKEKMEDIHRYFQRTNRLADVNRRLKSQIWSSVVTIVLVEAKNLLPMDIDGLSDPYVKFRLGTEKYKSKVVNKTLNPVWLEQFDLHLYEDPYLGQELEVTVWDRDRSHQDDLMGRTVIDLATLERETTHRLWRDLEDGSGSIFLLLTISGTTASETISDLAAHEETPQERANLYQRYALMNSLQRIRDVGHLTVKVYRAQGLAAADLGGKSDPFCVLELVNSRLQTQTEYKTLAPNWQKIFTFNVKDINSVLEVTVYDEDRDHKVEFLGKVAIPLLRIRNGEKRWYALKDKKLRGRAKGCTPQILLEMTVVWNIVRACVRTLNPKEKKYMEPEVKFKRQVFLRNVFRLKAIIVIFIDIGKYIQSCWEWESKMRSVFAFVVFIFGCYYFEPYMIPVMALLILLKYYLVALITGAPLTHHATTQLHDPTDGVYDDGPVTPGDDDDDEDDKDKEEKKTLKERLQAIQEVTHTVQNSIGYIASLCEKVKNLFNFTVPYLSYLAMLLAILGIAVLYIIPIRYLILLWGINKFSRKIVRPHTIPNNEVLDLISRVPDDEEILNYREIKPLPTTDCEKGSVGGSPGTSNLTRREQRKRHKAA